MRSERASRRYESAYLPILAIRVPRIGRYARIVGAADPNMPPKPRRMQAQTPESASTCITYTLRLRFLASVRLISPWSAMSWMMRSSIA
ncbi:hypothetical protein G1C96_1440 [Bifidobacterium sp. DSM 109958]|uniref:Uncharacterized protein n=1 Tax=Bifidobacterium moraviense TaxID=2675323 RepID=A0A7Y0HY30_9BIFI|nr:hypothetical protein [Bifidobacterium sp. DSM 109958]